MRKKTTIFTVVLFTLGAALALWGVLANTRALEPQMQAGGTPNLISYQGYLTDDSGQPINGAPDLEFGIYAALTGGTPLWSELQLNVPVNEGYFTVQLGSFTPIDADLFSDPDRYLQVSVNSGGGLFQKVNEEWKFWSGTDGNVMDVGVNQGGAWVTDKYDKIYYFTGMPGNYWKAIDGRAQQISVGKNGLPVVVNSAGEVYVRQ